ncbi:putative AP-3 complex subunit delta-1-like [Penaeus vannamei]|uniref:Putative AP-3 complex subunit delta-1-like n=1 Tax=Penaeus vannamei TaxID=6689 RepID=A0A3R7N3J9_PENVA|nr:putative AP-3 complex subunit delta-1-like [Penaeus vannamei]
MALRKVKGNLERMFDKNLTDLVRGIRNNKETEPKYIAQCMEEIKTELRQDNLAVKANAVAKLTYLQMLGYDISWAGFNIIEVMSSPKFTFKRIGYLAASQCFHQDTEVLMLTTNMIRKDLNSQNMYDSGTALTGLACFISGDLARDLANDVMTLLTSTKPYLRKKAVLLLYKVFLKFPEALRPAFPRLKEKLEDPDPGVQSAAVNVICELARKNPKNYLSLAPVFFKLMTSSTNNWMLIKIIKLFGALTPLEPRLGKKLIEPLTNLIHSTSAMSLLYECINTVIAVLISISSGMPNHNASIQLCVQKLRILIEDSDQNSSFPSCSLLYLPPLFSNLLSVSSSSIYPLSHFSSYITLFSLSFSSHFPPLLSLNCSSILPLFLSLCPFLLTFLPLLLIPVLIASPILLCYSIPPLSYLRHSPITLIFPFFLPSHLPLLSFSPSSIFAYPLLLPSRSYPFSPFLFLFPSSPSLSFPILSIFLNFSSLLFLHSIFRIFLLPTLPLHLYFSALSLSFSLPLLSFLLSLLLSLFLPSIFRIPFPLIFLPSLPLLLLLVSSPSFPSSSIYHPSSSVPFLSSSSFSSFFLLFLLPSSSESNSVGYCFWSFSFSLLSLSSSPLLVFLSLISLSSSLSFPSLPSLSLSLFRLFFLSSLSFFSPPPLSLSPLLFSLFSFLRLSLPPSLSLLVLSLSPLSSLSFSSLSLSFCSSPSPTSLYLYLSSSSPHLLLCLPPSSLPSLLPLSPIFSPYTSFIILFLLSFVSLALSHPPPTPFPLFSSLLCNFLHILPSPLPSFYFIFPSSSYLHSFPLPTSFSHFSVYQFSPSSVSLYPVLSPFPSLYPVSPRSLLIILSTSVPFIHYLTVPFLIQSFSASLLSTPLPTPSTLSSFLTSSFSPYPLPLPLPFSIQSPCFLYPFLSPFPFLLSTPLPTSLPLSILSLVPSLYPIYPSPPPPLPFAYPLGSLGSVPFRPCSRPSASCRIHPQ